MFTLGTFLTAIACLLIVAGVVTLGVVVAIRWQAASISDKYLSKLFDTQNEVAQELDRLQDEHQTKLNKERGTMLKAQQEQMAQVEEAARTKLSSIADYFRQSLDAEPTTKLMAAAYQYAAGSPQPRTTEESALIQAVLEHEKAGSPNFENPPLVGKGKEYLN